MTFPVPPSRFISFEGGEGVGKSTQVSHLVDHLQALGVEAVATREPGGSPKAEAIRNLLLSGSVAPFGPAAEAVMFAAARQDHVRMRIVPALVRGAWVVCDRFIDSTRAYQGAAGVDGRVISALESVAVGNLRPHLTVVLDMPGHAGLARAAARRGVAVVADRFEQLDASYHDRLRAAFLAIVSAEPDRCVAVDASGSANEVAATVWRMVETRLLDPARTTTD